MESKEASRRKFLKNVAAGGASLAVTGVVAKKVVDVVSENGVSGSDKSYLSRGETVLSQREYVEMTDAEKAEQVKMFIDNYKYENV